ncbi:hypothetical protein CK203_085891 [Vitis vinifera]|uniref:Uncharacterized protein n=1 Tax=Vitis vinifera TaxID=29760 RepID=A0A438DIC3_VITVI|nr:hypothetical protein CK203_085891 [Vitis vinifera]
MGGRQPIFAKGSLRRDYPYAKGNGKVGSKAFEAQLRGSVLKCGSKKLWNSLFPLSSGCRQGGRSRSEPLTLERPSASPSRSSGSRKRCSGEGTSPPSGDADQRSILKAPFLSKGKEKLCNSSKGEDKAGFKGFAGFPHCGSSVAVFPSYPVTREKGLNSVGSSGMMVVEDLESFSISFPRNLELYMKFFPKKMTMGAFCLGSVGNPNRDVAVSQLASLNHLSESFKSFKPNLGSPLGAPNPVTVSQGVAESPSMGGFQIEGLSSSRMAKVCEVLSYLDIKVYSRRKNRFYTDS